MTNQNTTTTQNSNRGSEGKNEAAVPAEADLTGEERLAWNVFAAWTGYFVVAAAGFLVPRFMDRSLGQQALGVWDFGWSLVSYFSLAELGVGSGIIRYVAKYRASGDVAALRRVAASVTGLSLAAGALTLLLTLASAWLLPLLMRADLISQLSSARWLVLLLGMTIASQLALQTYRGVLAGCHRFDVLNSITASFEALNSLAIVGVLFAGGGLIALGVVCFGMQLVADLTRMFFAYRACPELRVRLASADWSEARRLLRYGIKASIYSVSALLLIQANKLIVGGALGFATLAVFSRPLALIRTLETFASKFAYVLTPTASSLQSSGRQEQLSRLLLEMTRLGVALALPMVLLLAILGDPIMLLWMGPRYQPGLSMQILSLGYLGSLALGPVGRILFGMNLHGWPALVSLAGAALSVLLGMLNASVLHWGLTGAALAIAVPLSLSQVLIGAYACRKFALPVPTAVRYVLGAPAACVAPLATILLSSRVLLSTRPLLAILAGILLGGPTTALLYWRFVLPEALRAQIRALPRQLRGVAFNYPRRGRAES